MRKLAGREFWELRTGVSGDIYRTFYFAYTGRKFVLLHAYQKKSQKAPKKELEVAEERMKDYQSAASQKEEEMSERDESGTMINPEVEEDGREHLRELLEGNAEFRRIWEERRAGREIGLLVLKRRLELGISQGAR